MQQADDHRRRGPDSVSIEVVSEPDDGECEGLDRALRRVRGDLFLVLNADDEVLPHAATWGAYHMAANPTAAAVVGDQYVEGWLPDRAQQVMEQILTASDNRVDAVVCSNDGMAGGVVAALAAQGLDGLPVSGQDGDRAALQRVARGLQTVSVWKDARELGRAAGEIAVALAGGTMMGDVEGTIQFETPGGNTMNATLLAPVPV